MYQPFQESEILLYSMQGKFKIRFNDVVKGECQAQSKFAFKALFEEQKSKSRVYASFRGVCREGRRYFR